LFESSEADPDICSSDTDDYSTKCCRCGGGDFTLPETIHQFVTNPLSSGDIKKFTSI
jgi:hypothetical protein